MGGAMAIVYLLAIVLYIFAVIFTSNFKETFADFRRLDVSLLTLFEVMTLDQWSDLARDVMDEYRWARIPYCAFITVSTLFLANFVVAVLISAVVPNAGVVVGADMGNGATPDDVARLEAKVDQLLGMLEAIRQKQTYMDDFTKPPRTATMTIDEGEEMAHHGMMGSTRTARTATMTIDDGEEMTHEMLRY